MKNLIHPRLRPLVAYIVMVFLMCAPSELQAILLFAGLMGLVLYYVTPPLPSGRSEAGPKDQ